MSAIVDPSGAILDAQEVGLAAERLAPYVNRTPVLTSQSLDAVCGGSVFLKCENFQRVGAFKFRGAMHAVLRLDDQARRDGVITHSSGNHGQALARAGQILGVPVCVVMPSNAPRVKRSATEDFGARVVLCEPTLEARESTVERLIAERGYRLIHPFDNWDVIAGQGTAGWELLEQVDRPLDVVLAPVGGGGLLAGTALAVQARSPQTCVLAAEPLNADDAMRSLEAGRIIPVVDPHTVADGLKTSLGQRTFAVIQRHVERIVTVPEDRILSAMRFVWERFKILIEPSCAVAVAPLLNGQIDVNGQRVGVIITGGNVDLDPLFDHYTRTWLGNAND